MLINKTTRAKQSVDMLNSQVHKVIHELQLVAFRNKFGPKQFSQHQMVALLILKAKSGKSLRDFIIWLYESKWPEWLKLTEIPSKSTIHNYFQRFGMKIIRRINDIILQAEQVAKLAIDSTGIDLSGASKHYEKRIFREKIPHLKLSILADSDSKLIHDWISEERHVHDVQHAKRLVKRSSKRGVDIFADKAYDCEELMQLAAAKHNRLYCPIRDFRVKQPKSGRLRKKLFKIFDKKYYNTGRNPVECIMFLFKNDRIKIRSKKKLNKYRELGWNILAYNLKRLARAIWLLLQMTLDSAFFSKYLYKEQSQNTAMVLEKLGASLRGTLDKIKSAVFVDDKLINELVKDLQRALLQSDTNVQLVFKLGKAIKERAKEETPKTISKRDHLIKIVYEELTNFLGEETSELKLEKSPTTLMMVGLFGAGKTTTVGKLANYYKKRGKKVAVVQTDTWRPAAYEQLQQTANKINVDFYGDKDAKTPEEIYLKYKDTLQEKYDLIIVDTAGRDALSDDLVEELTTLHNAVQADEKLLVIQADLGQAAQKQAQMFHDVVKVTGVVVTKLEGTAKGGGALSACAVTGAKIKFIGVGEKVDDLEQFHPKRFVGQLLGMGDLETLLEKAQEAFKQEDAQEMSDRFMKGDFNLNDLYSQMEAMNKMGSFQKIMGMIPGMSNLKLPKEALQVQEGKLKKWKYIMDSMTNKEKEDPQLINPSRIDRVAQGSGTSARQVRDLLKQYRQSKKMMKMMKGSMGSMGSGKQDDKKMQKMMQKMQRKMGGKFPKM